MKKVFPLLVVLAIVFLIVSFFIPTERIITIPVRATLQNAVIALHKPFDWRSLDSGNKTHITEIRYMLYQISEPKKNGDSTIFTLAIVPDTRKQDNPNDIAFSYVHLTSLFYKLFPFLEKTTFDIRTVDELRSYLQDDTRFYGYPIHTQRLVDSFFIARQQDIRTGDIFKVLPGMIKDLEVYAYNNSCRVTARNISIAPLDHDSITLMVGVNVDKYTTGDNVHTFRQLPSTLGLLIGRFEGRFEDRPWIYAAMEKYIKDHGFMKRGLPYERYLSPIPGSDTSLIKIDLIYPVSLQ